MRMGFLQLPVPGHGASQAKANRPLAAAFMIGYARRHCRSRGWEAVIAPEELADHGGDAALAAWALEEGFDALLFTLYLWNRERSLFIARSVKRHRPSVVTVAGGPEVTPDQDAADFPGIDLLCAGEGEEFFARFVDDGAARSLRGIFRAGEIADLGRVPDPYLSGLLPVRDGEIVHFEQMRGCPERCAYCYYGKGRRRVRRFPPDRVEGIFRLAAARAGTEVYFMDPTFNGREGLAGRLERVERANPRRVPIHTEVRLERIDRATADRMAAAGVRSVEAGLQSVNPAALEAVGRSWDREAFLAGAGWLLERGIGIRTGIIVGLPEDDLEGLLSTLDFLEGAGLAGGVEAYLLSLLPGTRLRRLRDRWGIRAMDRPPYWALRTNRMRPEDFAAALEILERRLGIDYFAPIPPLGGGAGPGLRSLVDLRGGALDGPLPEPATLARSVLLLLDAAAADDVRLRSWAGRAMAESPHTCWRLLHAGSESWPAERWRRLRGLFYFPGHFLNRGRRPGRDPQGAFSVRLFQAVDDAAAARSLLDASPEAELAAVPRPGEVPLWREACREAPWVLLDPRLGPRESGTLAAWCADRPGRVIDLPFPLYPHE